MSGMGLLDRINSTLRKQQIRNLDERAKIEEIKAGKSLRRTKPHVREAERLRLKADKLRQDQAAGMAADAHAPSCVCKACCDARLARRRPVR